MANSGDTPIYWLPQELLLRIAFFLPDSTDSQHLRSFCLASKQLSSAAQDALLNRVEFRGARLGHTADLIVNPGLKLLRTIIERPDLAPRVRHLRASTSRVDISKLCSTARFDLQALRTQCVSLLRDLGYEKTHPWWRSLENSVESAFSGLLLVLLPNLTHLYLEVYDNCSRHLSIEAITGLFGCTIPPEAITSGWNSLQHLMIKSVDVLKCGIQLPNLTSLELSWIKPATIFNLNGPGCLEGTANLTNLGLMLTIDFLNDSPNDGVRLSILLEALACNKLRNLTITFWDNTSGLPNEYQLQHLDARFFLKQLCSVEKTLEELTIDFILSDDPEEMDLLLIQTIPGDSWKQFSALTKLILPTTFLLDINYTNRSCFPKDLPPKLELLGLMYPSDNVLFWAEDLISDSSFDLRPCLPNFKQIFLTCHDEIGDPADSFTDPADKVWNELYQTYDIQTLLLSLGEQTMENLTQISAQRLVWIDGMAGFDDGVSETDTSEDSDEESDGDNEDGN